MGGKVYLRPRIDRFFLKIMKQKISYSFLRMVCALIMGLILVLFPNEAGNYLVITVGVAFLIPSLLGLIGYWTRQFSGRFPIEAVGSMLFGLWLVVMPGFFADFLTFVLGFILLMGGVQQVASLLAARSWMKVPAGYFVLPVLILLAGLLALFNPTGARSTAFLVIGIACLTYACSELLNWVKFTRRRPQPAAPSAGKRLQSDEVVDAEIIE